MKSNFINKAKLSCKTIAVILVAAIVIVSVDGCGKSKTGVSIRALGRVVGIQEGSLCIDVDMDLHSRTSRRLDDEYF